MRFNLTGKHLRVIDTSSAELPRFGKLAQSELT